MNGKKDCLATFLIIIFVFTVIITSACTDKTSTLNENNSYSPVKTATTSYTKTSSDLSQGTNNPDNALKVHFIDVGQGDSELIQYKGKNMLIDAGNTDEGPTVVSYLKSQNVSGLDIVLATHSHEDHIGGLNDVLLVFPVGEFIDSGYSSNTPAFQNIMNIVKNKQIPLETVRTGDQINFDPDLPIKVLYSSETEAKDPNDNSIVLKLKQGKVNYLFMGDASTSVETKLLSGGEDLQADILKVGHHGSTSSSGTKFLSRVNPKISLIEVGSELSHSTQSLKTLIKLENIGSKVYQTSESGTITITSDGKHYSVSHTR